MPVSSPSFVAPWRLGLGLGAVAVLSGCIVVPAGGRHHGGYGGGPAGQGAAGGYGVPAPDVSDGPVVGMAPPAVVYEPAAAAPGPGYFWISGFWTWQLGRHVWIGGRWSPQRPGYVWRPHRWVPHGSGWREMPGRWGR